MKKFGALLAFALLAGSSIAVPSAHAWDGCGGPSWWYGPATSYWNCGYNLGISWNGTPLSWYWHW